MSELFLEPPNVCYADYLKGEGRVTQVKTAVTFNYVEKLFNEVFQLRKSYPSYAKAKTLKHDGLPPLTKVMQTVPKADVLRKYQSRLSMTSEYIAAPSTQKRKKRVVNRKVNSKKLKPVKSTNSKK